jgi:hypothetical protein
MGSLESSLGACADHVAVAASDRYLVAGSTAGS